MQTKITFGDWQLRHMDGQNWQLYRREATATNKRTLASGTAGKVRWKKLEMYYHSNALHHAVNYAAHEDIGCMGKDMTLGEFLSEYERIAKEMAEVVSGGLKNED